MIGSRLALSLAYQPPVLLLLGFDRLLVNELITFGLQYPIYLFPYRGRDSLGENGQVRRGCSR
jgi:hypothetical protein